MDLPVPVPWPWTVVLPVKGGPTAKTRLAGLGALRPALAAAVAADTLAAVAATSRVQRIVVVTGDRAAAGTAAAAGAIVVSDPGHGLDGAVAAGLAVAGAHRPTAVLQADLPALRPGDLAKALDACTSRLVSGALRVVVADADDDGTVLMAAVHPAALHPAYGPGSARRHASGGLLLDLPVPRLRRDVDTPADLGSAVRLGVGPATRAVLATPRTS